MRDEEIEKLEGVANTLRGMSLDPRIPADARAVLMESAQEIDSVTDSYLGGEDE